MDRCAPDDSVPSTDATDPFSVSGRRVVVTGGARGIGAEIARTFVEGGARVAVIDVLADELATVCEPLEAVAVVGDLTDPESTRRATVEAIDALGGIDVLVNNAGVFSIVPLLEIDPAEWDRTFAINVRAMLVTTQVAGAAMIAAARGGRIVNMASMGGKDGAPGQAHYAASKAAVISLTQVTAKELGPHGITANCLCPGYVLTEMGAESRTAEQIAEWSALSPLGRLGSPRDVAGVTRFLASEAGSYLTGQAVNVTGGMLMR